MEEGSGDYDSDEDYTSEDENEESGRWSPF